MNLIPTPPLPESVQVLFIWILFLLPGFYFWYFHHKCLGRNISSKVLVSKDTWKEIAIASSLIYVTLFSIYFLVLDSSCNPPNCTALELRPRVWTNMILGCMLIPLAFGAVTGWVQRKIEGRKATKPF